MASEDVKRKSSEKVQEVEAEADAKVSDDLASISAPLRRTMKNRHIAMIRSVVYPFGDTDA